MSEATCMSLELPGNRQILCVALLGCSSLEKKALGPEKLYFVMSLRELAPHSKTKNLRLVTRPSRCSAPFIALHSWSEIILWKLQHSISFIRMLRVLFWL